MEKLEMKGLELEYSEELNNLKYEIINEYNQGEQPETEQEYNQGEQPEREQEYNHNEQPETEQEYNQGEQPETEQEYNQGEQPETEQEYNQGEQPEREQEYNHNGQSEKKMYRGVVLDPYKKYNVCANPLAKSMGSKTFEGHVETYYTANPKARPHFNIHKTASPVPGVHIAEIKQGGDGTVRDKDGYIVLACNGFKFGTIIMTSLGPGKVYDRGGMKRKNHIDIFTNR